MTAGPRAVERRCLMVGSWAVAAAGGSAIGGHDTTTTNSNSSSNSVAVAVEVQLKSDQHRHLTNSGRVACDRHHDAPVRWAADWAVD